MRVYAESNFVLELVLEQAAHEACAELLHQAESGALQLVLPAFAIAEPVRTLQRRSKRHSRVARELGEGLVEIRRTRSLSEDFDSMLDSVEEMVVRAEQAARHRFVELRGRLSRAAEILPLTSDVLVNADELSHAHALPLPDAIMLATILLDPRLGEAPACFVNTNTKDFGDDPSIVALLRDRRCKLLARFDAALSYATRAHA